LPVLIIVIDVKINLLLIIESANLFDTVAVIIINYLNFNHFVMRISQLFNLILVLATKDAATNSTARPVGAFSDDNT
jgi:hypothetical protein